MKRSLIICAARLLFLSPRPEVLELEGASEPLVDTGVLSCLVVSDSRTPRIIACQAPLSTGFSREEYWSGLPFPSPQNLPEPGTEHSLQADSLLSEPPFLWK